jgi:hypothetical protein
MNDRKVSESPLHLAGSTGLIHLIVCAVLICLLTGCSVYIGERPTSRPNLHPVPELLLPGLNEFPHVLDLERQTMRYRVDFLTSTSIASTGGGESSGQILIGLGNQLFNTPASREGFQQIGAPLPCSPSIGLNAVTQDGQWLACFSEGAGPNDISIVPLGKTGDLKNQHVITWDLGRSPRSVSWSPDGRLLGAVTPHDHDCDATIYPVISGDFMGTKRTLRPQIILRFPDFFAAPAGISVAACQLYQIDWSPDAHFLTLVTGISHDRVYILPLASVPGVSAALAETGQGAEPPTFSIASAMVTLIGSESARAPAWIPGSDSLLLVDNWKKIRRYDMMTRQGTTELSVPETGQFICALTATSDGQAVVFTYCLGAYQSGRPLERLYLYTLQ